MIQNLRLSLTDLVGEEYIAAVCAASEALGIGSRGELKSLADTPVDFFPPAFSIRMDDLAGKVGKRLAPPFTKSSPGAATDAFASAFHSGHAPLSALGCFRLGEDGFLSFTGKSEHYQASLGHGFPGYRLLEHAARIGITNITHNNTRGHITRLLERELIRVANGLAPGDEAGLQQVLASREPHVLNRVINLETGSLACEAAFKMMLARFHKLQPNFPAPEFEGKTPVFLVMADYNGGPEANYHGTTVMTQMLRGLWPGLGAAMESAGLMRVVPVPVNDACAFAKAMETWHRGAYRVAGFMHELILMNYGAIQLDPGYVSACHALCRDMGVPVFVDEIQTGMWSPELFLFKEYDLRPDFVSVGKGFPGGIYPASRILTTAPMDNLNQFGALVTNGQEELASLAYLVTIRFTEHNAAHLREIGDAWQDTLRKLLADYPDILRGTGGRGLMGSLVFEDAETAAAFSHIMTDRHHMDVSAQTYKANCPPAALFKPPLIVSRKMVGFMLRAMDESLKDMELNP